MTSDMRGQEFFRLSDERDAASQHKAFFEFATLYGYFLAVKGPDPYTTRHLYRRSSSSRHFMVTF